MTQDPKFAVQLLDKIGAQLAAAIESVPLEGDDTDVEAAKLMAQMLGQAVQMSIALSNALNLEEDEQQADATRVALASIATILIANFYKHNSRIAEESDIKRMTKSLEAVLSFAENFSPASDESSRIATLENDSPLFDKTQPTLVILQALSPVINAIAEFPFGVPETKLVQDVSTKLESHASSIAKESGLTDKLSELLIFKSLAQIYTECHKSETEKLASANDDNRAELSIDPVWQAYETKLAMVKTLVGISATSETSSGETSPEIVQDQSPPTSAEQKPVEIQPPVEPTAPPPAQEAPAGAGPMGFFAKKPEDQSPPAPAEQQPAEGPPPAEPAAPPPPPPTNETPPQSPPAEDTSGDAGDGSSPMSFFKSGPKTDTDEGGTGS